MNFYLTTPIYYPNGNMHIGHTYCSVACDALVRYKKARGYDVFFQTGLDEHGQKVERAAAAEGITPQKYVDDICAETKKLWQIMGVEYDCFLRTTEERHVKAVQKIFKKLYEQGDIYKGNYEGLYCVPCETFFTERELKDGACPDCGRPVETTKEECYFFKLSKYGDRLLKFIEENPNFMRPESRKNEMINFIKQGLDDLCVSRTTFKWGVPVDFDSAHVVYVWIDALTNYITSLGYTTENNELYNKYWENGEVVHIVGKEIFRFHTIIWPAFLMALDLPLPKSVFGHGWLLLGGKKIGKSLGNSIYPAPLVEKYGLDAMRYFLLREISFGQDGNFTEEALVKRLNSDLANDFGNLLSRTVSMIEKYFPNGLPEVQTSTDFDKDLISLSKSTVEFVCDKMDNLFFSDALSDIWTFIRRANKYIDETQPWLLAKDDAKKDILANVLYNLSECLRFTGILIAPFMPNSPKEIFTQLNVPSNLQNWESLSFGLLPKNVSASKGAIIFPRREYVTEEDETPSKQEITIEKFAETELKIGTILECEKVKGSDKLLCSQIKIGDETRQIVSGIAKFFTPQQMIGKTVVVVTNLKPVKIHGVLSAGMILCANNPNGSLSIVTAENAADGALIS